MTWNLLWLVPMIALLGLGLFALLHCNKARLVKGATWVRTHRDPFMMSQKIRIVEVREGHVLYMELDSQDDYEIYYNLPYEAFVGAFTFQGPHKG